MSGRTLWFALALVVQVALLAAVPWDREADESSTQTIWLEAQAGGDRHDLMRGEYVNLTYDISDLTQFADAAEVGEDRGRRSGEVVYAIVEELNPGVWSGVRIETDLPPDLPNGQVAIKGMVSDRGLKINAFLRQEADGTWAADSVVTGEMPRDFDREQKDRALADAWVTRQMISYQDIESYFVPASERQRLEEDLLAHPEEVLAEVRVGENGSASLLQMRIQDRVYDF
jgi:uncharacterized membrane-anchored protein